MRTFMQNPKAIQQTTFARITIPARVRFGQSREVNSILDLEHSMGNQAVQGVLEENSGDVRGYTTATERSLFSHDFSGIPVNDSQVPAHTVPRESASLRSYDMDGSGRTERLGEMDKDAHEVHDEPSLANPVWPHEGSGSGPGEGRRDKLPSNQEVTPEAPAIDDPANASPAQGSAVPMAVTAVDNIKANIGSDGRNIAHVPPCGNQPRIQFTASPRSAAPVTWSIDPGSTAPVASGTVLTPATSTLTATLSFGASQKGGELDIKAENREGGQVMPYRLASHPIGIASTSTIGDPTNTTLFGGVFDHVFESNDGQASSLDQVVVGEKFPRLPTPDAATHTFPTPFGTFTLTTGRLPNTPAAGNWFLTSAGELGDDHDTVGIQKSLVDIGRHLVSDSNPTPANPMPTGFTVDQQFFWWCPHAPAGNRWTQAATTTHIRTLRMDKSGKGAEFVATVNGQENIMAYDGPQSLVKTGVTKATADPATVAPSPAGGTPNTVQISADAFPAGRSLYFSIQGNAHGCTINHATGELTVGAQTGSVKVRVANASGGSNWDEVDVTIAIPTAPASKP